MNNVRALWMLFVVLSPSASAATAGLAVESGAGDASARTYQLMTFQALQDAGLQASDADVFQRPVERAAALTATREAKFDRLFMLHVSPMKEGALLSLEEVDLGDGDAVHRATLLCARDIDAQRTLGRLVKAVLNRESVEDGQRVSTITEAEGQAFAKRPGEFLNGFSVAGGLVAADLGEATRQLFGFGYHFKYEMPHVNFGASVAWSFSESSHYFDMTIRSAYLFSEGNTSGYLGGGLGFAVVNVDRYELGLGGEVLITGGVEMFRLHAARFAIGLEVALPLFNLETYNGSRYDYETEQYITQPVESIYPMAVSLTLGVLF